MEKGFDNEKYLTLQSENILKRIEMFNNKLYLEFGGKLFDDYHAARILPGFDPNIKTKLLMKLKDKAEILICINANDIEKNRIRADLEISYDNEVLRLIDNLREKGLYVSAIVITLYNNQPNAEKFACKLKRRGERVYFHGFTKGYPNDVETIVSDEGYGANPYIETTRPLVVVTAPGPNSGKLATSLTQLYHEYKRGIKAGYAKFETFPVWNMPLKHPVNIAYEAATADLKDINQIDPYYYSAYGKVAVNYNRDIEVFPVLKNILRKITNEDIYTSPTNMGVNMVGNAVINDEIVSIASKKEVVRRYLRAKCDYLIGRANLETIERLQFLMSELDVNENYLKVVSTAKELTNNCQSPLITLELSNGQIVTGKPQNYMSASGQVVLNAVRTLASLPENEDLIPKEILLPITKLRCGSLGSHSCQLTLDDVLVALSISAETNENAKKALNQLENLSSCDAFSTFILSSTEEKTLKKLGINISCYAQYLDNKLFNN